MTTTRKTVATTTTERTLIIRQYAINVALEVAKMRGNAEGLLAVAKEVEQYALTGELPAAVVPVSEPVAETPAKTVRRARK